MSVYVSGIGIISSLGKNYSEHKQHLFDLKEGISKHLYKNHDSILESYTGSITSDPEVPEQYKDECIGNSDLVELVEVMPPLMKLFSNCFYCYDTHVTPRHQIHLPLFLRY